MRKGEVLGLDVEVVGGWGLEKEVSWEKGGKVRGKMVVEGGKGGSRGEGDGMVGEKGVLVVGDILGKWGGVVGWYFGGVE
ncbi:hypothetical protein, partial [Neisseria sicca]|uniref:hypothetical protein n=1 Tax=Neisseria sicca TaxID=490 RepID=UPI003F689E6B